MRHPKSKGRTASRHPRIRPGVEATRTYLAQLADALPADITGAYLGVRASLDPEQSSNDKNILLFGVVILCITPFYLYYLRGIRTLPKIVFLSFSYVTWAANVDIMRIREEDQVIKEFLDNYPYLAFTKFMIDPAFIKGMLVIWVGLLIPFVMGNRNRNGKLRNE